MLKVTIIKFLNQNYAIFNIIRLKESWLLDSSFLVDIFLYRQILINCLANEQLFLLLLCRIVASINLIA